MKKILFILCIGLLCNCSTEATEDLLPENENTSQNENEEEETEETETGNDDTPGDPVADYGTCAQDANAPIGFATVDVTPTGGEGGESLTVTTADELKNALKREEPLIIYVKGEIETDDVISVLATDKTVLGLTGSVLTNPNRTEDTSGILYFKEGSDNLILRNLTFKSAGAYDTDGRDNLCIDGTTNIWVDHCDFQDGVDGNFDCKNASDNIAVTWCRFRYLIEPLAGGSGGSDDHRYSNLWGNSDSSTQDRGKLRTTFQYCWWDEGCRDRMPRVRYAQVHLVNCLYSSSVASHCIGAGKEANVLAEGCDFTDLKYDKIYRYYNDDALVQLKDCLSSLDEDDEVFSNTAFTPPYELTNTVSADEVESIVSQYAGATLNITLEE